MSGRGAAMKDASWAMGTRVRTLWAAGLLALAVVGGLTGGFALTSHAATPGRVVSWGYDSWGQVSAAPATTGFVAVAAGTSHSVALTTDGRIVAWGWDGTGLVSAAPRGTGYTAVAAGEYHSVAIAADGTLVSWGYDSYGQVSNTPSGSGFTAVAAGDHHSVALTSEGHVVSWGDDRRGLVSDTPIGAGFTAIAAGGSHSVAIAADGTLVSWGSDTNGQVSATPAAAGFTAVAADTCHSVAITADGALASWGCNYWGQVSDTPVGTGFTAVAAGGSHSLALTADGTLVSWGSDYNRQVSDTPTGAVFTAIAAGGQHSLALTAADPVQTFPDVPPTWPFFREVEWLAAEGITTGYPDGTFRPLQSINRDAMAAFLYRFTGSPAFTPPADSPFVDMTPETMFYKEVTWLAHQGIATGWTEPDGTRTFRPLQPINRDAMAAFLFRLDGVLSFDCETPRPSAPGQLAFSGMAYGPYHLGQSPDAGSVPSPEAVTADILTLARLTGLIHIYSSQGPATAIVQAAERNGLCVGLGVWLSGEAAEDAREISAVGPLAASPAVRSVTVGSEVLLRGDMTVAELRAAIAQVRATVGSAVDITVADTYNEWLEHPELAEDVDFLTVNIYPFWEQVSIDAALSGLERAYAQVAAAFPGRRIVIGETGWPSGGSPFGAAVPSPASQARYVREFVEWAENNQVEYVYFEAFDESWKVGEGDVGPTWGLYREDGMLKPALAELLPPADPETVRQRSFRDVWVGGLSQGFGLGVDTSGGLHDWVQTLPDRLLMSYPAGQAWGVVYITAGQPAPPGVRSAVDLSRFVTLVAEVRAPDGEECVRIGIKDVTQPDNGSETTAAVCATGEWTPVALPLDSFPGADPSRLYVVFEVVFQGPAGGSLEVRNVRYSPEEVTAPGG